MSCTCSGHPRPCSPRRRPPAGVVALAAAAGAALVVWTLRARALRWGSLPSERTARLPGDDLLPSADLVATRAITIDAPQQAVWPWVVQLGQGRGGFYSYDALENLVGCDIHSADVVVPQWQDLAVGDPVHLAPRVALEAVVVDPGHALVLRGAAGATDTPPPYDFTWAFVLRPTPEGRTRLVVRERYRYAGGGVALLVEPVSWISFVMTRKMLDGIRARAERP